MKAIFTMFFSPETVVNSDDESGSSHESDYDPLTAAQDVCTIINPPTASTSPKVAQPTLNKKKGRRGKHVDKNLGIYKHCCQRIII